MPRKLVQFDYLRFSHFVDNKNGAVVEKILALEKLLSQIEAADFKRTCKIIDEEEHRIYVCKNDPNTNIWEVQLLRQREEVAPGISYEDGTYKLISLEDGQYIAESSTVLYDADNGILLFQRNRFGYSIHALQEYISSFYKDKSSIKVEPIVKENQINRITDTSCYRKVILVSDGTIESKEEESSLMKILRTFDVYQGKYITIEISMGRLRKRNLRSKATAELIREAYRSQSTTLLKARLSSSSDTRVETIDLLNDRESISVTLEYSRENPISHERLFKACKDEYILRNRGK